MRYILKAMQIKNSIIYIRILKQVPKYLATGL
jgi:hypothetical protein